MRVGFLPLLVVLSCARGVREEQREQAVDTGLEVKLAAQGERRWDFGDGSPPLVGSAVAHAFHKAGRYEVKAFEGEVLTDRISVLVQPREAFHAIVPTADAALVFRSTDEVAPAIDFVERLGSAASVQRLLELFPVFHFLLEPGRAGVAIDRLEGAGVFFPREADTAVTFFGAVDGEAAAKAFGEFLVDHAWAHEGDVFSAGPRLGKLFVDRGTVFFVSSDSPAHLQAAEDEVRRAPWNGLEAEPTSAAAIAELASGGVAVLVRPQASASVTDKVKPGAWSIALAALKFEVDQARLVGRFVGHGPLWKTPTSVAPKRLLVRAPDGPAAALSMDVPLAEVLQAVGLSPKDLDDDEELRAGLSVLSRRLELALYFDVDEFLRATLRKGGKPEPKVTVLAETAVPDRAVLRAVLERSLARRNVPFETFSERGFDRWRTLLADAPLELVLHTELLTATWGQPLGTADSIDLVGLLSKRVEGACGPGHLSGLLDVGQVKRQLLEPRQVAGLDPRMVVTTQALTATFLTQATAVDQVIFDVAPAPTGATFFVEVRLSKPDSRE